MSESLLLWTRPTLWESGPQCGAIGFPLQGKLLALYQSPLPRRAAAQLCSGEASFRRALEQITHALPDSPLGEWKLVGRPEQVEAAKKILEQKKVQALVKSAQREDTRHLCAIYSLAEGRLRLGPLEALESPPPAAKSVVTESARPAPRRVLIVDDSKTIRELLKRVISTDRDLEVVGESGRPSEVMGLIEKLRPDVMTLDINMPEMDGVTLLSEIMPRRPLPVLVISSVSLEEGEQVLQALELGAVDYLQKPTFQELSAMAPVILEKIKAAAAARVEPRAHRPRSINTVSITSEACLRKLVVIGASTGGTEAIKEVFRALPARIPPILVVQHIPPVFSKAFAQSLDALMPFQVKEAVDGDEVRPDRVLIAPGGQQMELVERQGRNFVRIFDGPPVNRHKPSVDVLFHSVAKRCAQEAVAVLLTGMGADGARGLLALRQAGARTVAQDEASSVVFGMPREAIKLGAAEKISPLSEVAAEVARLLGQRRKAA